MARAHGDATVGSAHLLLAPFRDPATRAARALGGFGCSYDHTRTRLVELFPELVTGRTKTTPSSG